MNDFFFEFCLFSVDPTLITEAVLAGIQTIIVDWENKHKLGRQKNYDTEINYHTKKDLACVRKATKKRVICRINPIDEDSEKEISSALFLGADEILIPMVQSPKEVKWALDFVGKKGEVSILIETNSAALSASEFSKLPLKRIYVGLNDLAIENHSPYIFTPVETGLLDQLRDKITGSFGFGGITLPHLGAPISASLLIGELLRLGCNFSFLRRSFIKDTQGKNLSSEVSKLKEAFEQARDRPVQKILEDHQELIYKIQSLTPSYAKNL